MSAVKSYILILCVLMIAVKLQAQVKQDPVATYYKLKNKAELMIIDSNYNAALKLYGQAFTYKKPNIRELYNAFVTAYITGNELLANKYYDEMVLHGLDKSLFDITFFFGQIYAKEPLYKKISQDYDSLKKIADRSDMPAVARMLDSLFIADQAVRNEDSRKMAGVDSANRDFLFAYIVQNGFPGFEQTGFYDKMLGGSCPRNPTTFWVMMWHARYGGATVLDAVMKQAVMNGGFPPEDYAFLMDVHKDDARIYFEIMPHQVINQETVLMMPAEAEEINKKRAEIYLDNLSDYKKKLEYSDRSQFLFQFINIMGFSLIYAK